MIDVNEKATFTVLVIIIGRGRGQWKKGSYHMRLRPSRGTVLLFFGQNFILPSLYSTCLATKKLLSDSSVCIHHLRHGVV